MKKKNKKAENLQRAQRRREEKAKQKSLLERWSIIALCVFAIVFFAFLSFNKSKLFAAQKTAVEVGNTEVSAASCNYYVRAYKESLSQTYGSSLADMVDLSVPLDKQQYPSDPSKTWADVFFDSISEEIHRDYALFNAALDSGYTVTEEDTSAVEAYISSIKNLASAYGFSSMDAYLRSYYGRGCCEENYFNYRLIKQIGKSYTERMNAANNPSVSELEKEYSDNRERFESVSYRSFFFSSKEYGAAEAAERAKEFEAALCGNEENFIALCERYAPDDEKELYRDADATLTDHLSVAAVSSVAKEWLTDSGRVYGDSAVIPFQDYGYYVYFFLGYENNDYPLVNLIHVFVSPDEVKDTGSWQAAEKKAEDLFAKICEEGCTAEAFSNVAVSYSSSPTKGYLTDIHKGSYSSALEEWCFSEGRKIGDCGIVRTDSGYQIIYLASFGENYRDTLARERILGRFNDELSQKDMELYPLSINRNGCKAISF